MAPLKGFVGDAAETARELDRIKPDSSQYCFELHSMWWYLHEGLNKAFQAYWPFAVESR